MRAELINLPFTTDMSRRLDPPLFLLQLAPILEQENFTVRVNDLNGMDHNQWGFGHCMMYVIYADGRGFETALEIARFCRHINEKAIIIACGSGPSKATYKYLDSTEFNIVIKGEIEYALLAFVRDSFRDLKDTTEQVYKNDVANINRLPFPARNLVEMNTYQRKLAGSRATMIMGSRGSPFGATWICSKLKNFSIKRIMNEVTDIVRTYGIRSFFFGDVCFTNDQQRALGIAKAFKEYGLQFGFNDVISSVNVSFYIELEKLGAREVLINPLGNKDDDYIRNTQQEITTKTGMRAIVRKDTKYTDRKEGVQPTSEEKSNGKPVQPEPENSILHREAGR